MKQAIPKDMSLGNTRHGAGYGSPYAQGYGPSVDSYGPRPDSNYGPPLAGNAGYPPYVAGPSYGPAAYGTTPAGYGKTPGYGTSMNGGYGAVPVYGAAIGYAGGARGSFGASFSGTLGRTAYGSGTTGYVAGIVRTAVGGRTGWGPSAGSPGYPTGNYTSSVDL